MSVTTTGSAIYETTRAVDQYLDFHFASSQDLSPYHFGLQSSLDFCKRCAELCSRFASRDALDIGCAVGGTTFELARYFDSVVGIDYSKAFIEAANKLKRDKTLPYIISTEGALTETRVACIDAKINCNRVSFQVGDACNLPPNLSKVDLIFGGNLLCRLPQPVLFLDRAYSLLREGGILVLTTPCSWLEQWTDKSKWLGGYIDDSGKEVLTSEGIDRALKPKFQLLERGKMPFMIREHSRKFQWGLADYHVFKKTPLKANL